MSHRGRPLVMIKRGWLKKLAQELWFADHSEGPTGLRWNGLDLVAGHEPRRKLRSDEFSGLIEIMQDHGLPCRLLGHDVSYNLCVAVYDHTEQPGLHPDPIFAFCDRHLPSTSGEWPNLGWPDLDYARQSLSTFFTHTPHNLALLKVYRLPPPEGRETFI